ncbi:MAG: dihydropteroate synthase [Propionibacteriaceae bacterium]|nr:dihydropteroate synthase [Propionibacteriaceae bacterium]
MTVVMGVLNVTPDSFSDGGRYATTAAAIAQGERLAAEGAVIVDVGGESTRPGAGRVPADEEQARVVPVITALARQGIVCSVDTMRADTARAAVEAGARLVNDVSAGLADPTMLSAVAELDVDYVAMHWRAPSDVMQQHAVYTDVTAEVRDELLARRDAALVAGVAPRRIILDPGIGFAKTPEQNWELLRHLDTFQALGQRLLIGVSRKRFLGELLGGRDPEGRDAATAAVSTWCALHGVWGVRTHEIPAQLDAVAVGQRLGAAPDRVVSAPLTSA